MDNQPVIRAAIQNVVSKGIRDIRRDPNRSIRRLVDLGIQFGKGHYQQTFFSDAQSALRNRHSAYYALVTSLIRNVDPQTLETLGLNVGYMSWTLGAKMIRAYEKENGINVPWTILINLTRPVGCTLDLSALVSQGQQLGIYTYFLTVGEQTTDPDRILATASQHPSSAFFLLSADETVNAWMVARDNLPCNTLIIPRCGIQDQADISVALAQHKQMFVLNCVYDANNVDELLSEAFLQHIVEQGCSFLFYIPAPDCDAPTRERVYAEVLSMRSPGRYPLFPVDLLMDVQQVDHIISDEQCMLELGADGTVLYPAQAGSLSVNSLPLEELIRLTMPRVHRHR